jgi:hypothetical protein
MYVAIRGVADAGVDVVTLPGVSLLHCGEERALGDSRSAWHYPALSDATASARSKVSDTLFSGTSQGDSLDF